MNDIDKARTFLLNHAKNNSWNLVIESGPTNKEKNSITLHFHTSIGSMFVMGNTVNKYLAFFFPTAYTWPQEKTAPNIITTLAMFLSGKLPNGAFVLNSIMEKGYTIYLKYTYPASKIDESFLEDMINNSKERVLYLEEYLQNMNLVALKNGIDSQGEKPKYVS